MTARLNPGVMSSARADWPSPANVLELVREFAPIGLDPCANPASIVVATYSYTLPDADGLALPWSERGLVYVNPPYGREIVKWVDKALVEAAKECEIIALIPARTDARWFHALVGGAQAVCFWRGRLKFLGAPTSAPFPSALVYLGERATRFERVFGKAGKVVKL